MRVIIAAFRVKICPWIQPILRFKNVREVAQSSHLDGIWTALRCDAWYHPWTWAKVQSPPRLTCPIKILHHLLSQSRGEYGNKIVFHRETCLVTSSGSLLEGSGLAPGAWFDRPFNHWWDMGYGDAFLIAGTSMKNIILKEPVHYKCKKPCVGCRV